MKTNAFNNKNLNYIINQINFHPKKRMIFFGFLSEEKKAFVLYRLNKKAQSYIISKLKNQELIKILEHLDPGEATDLVRMLSFQKQKKLISKIKKEMQDSIRILAKFDPKTAAGIMNVDYIQIEDTDTVKEVAKQFKEHEKRTGRLPTIIAMKQNKAVGYVPGHSLGFGRPSEAIKKYIKKISTIKYNADYNEVIKLLKTMPHGKVAVIGKSGNILGIIYSDDILRLLDKKESASLYEFAGLHNEESISDSALKKAKNRYKWLIVNLGTAFLAALTVGLFDKVIARYVLLAVYMPIVAGMGGNAGTQTLAVLVRGLALNSIDFKTALKILKRELGSSLINGIINGVIIATVVIMISGDYKIAFILAFAMVVNLLVAGFFGTVVPLFMKKIGKDPATSATIFITTATDVLGFMVFLGLASLFL